MFMITCRLLHAHNGSFLEFWAMTKPKNYIWTFLKLKLQDYLWISEAIEMKSLQWYFHLLRKFFLQDILYSTVHFLFNLFIIVCYKILLLLLCTCFFHKTGLFLDNVKFIWSVWAYRTLNDWLSQWVTFKSNLNSQCHEKNTTFGCKRCWLDCTSCVV